MSTGLVVTNATVIAGGRPILDGVDFSAEPGKLTGLIGPNGAGKSTLMRAVIGVVPLDTGGVTFESADLPTMPRRTRAQMSAFVEQTGSSEVHLSAREVVMLGRIPFQSIWQSAPSPDDEKLADDALAAVGMSQFSDRLYHSLSGGEQQRLHIARALAQQPKLLLLDEPTNHLDVNAQLTILNQLRSRARAGATVLLALHDLNLAAAFCDSLVVLHQGRQVAEGPPEQVLTPALLRRVYNIEATLLQHPRTGRPMIAYDLPA